MEWGERSAELAERFHDVQTLAMALNMIGTSHVMAGEIERGIGYLHRSIDVAREHDLDYWIATGHSMLGSGLGEMYELELAERHLRAHIAFADEHGLDASYTSSWLAAALAYQGRWDEAVRVAHDVLRRAQGAISPMTALIALGRVRQGCPYEAARALAESEDEQLLLKALSELERLGAQPAAKLVRQTLRTRGAAVPRGPRPATRSNPAELTSRELDVLRLVAAGMRNSEVADELVLSRRTVDHHVSAILRKLSVRTRGEAAAAATRLGPLEQDT